MSRADPHPHRPGFDPTRPSLIVPSPDGELLSLMWGDACSTAELSRSPGWNTRQHAALHAAWISSGQA